MITNTVPPGQLAGECVYRGRKPTVNKIYGLRPNLPILVEPKGGRTDRATLHYVTHPLSFGSRHKWRPYTVMSKTYCTTVLLSIF